MFSLSLLLRGFCNLVNSAPAMFGFCLFQAVHRTAGLLSSSSDRIELNSEFDFYVCD